MIDEDKELYIRVSTTLYKKQIDLIEYLFDVKNRTADWKPNTPIKNSRKLLSLL